MGIVRLYKELLVSGPNLAQVWVRRIRTNALRCTRAVKMGSLKFALSQYIEEILVSFYYIWRPDLGVDVDVAWLLLVCTSY